MENSLQQHTIIFSQQKNVFIIHLRQDSFEDLEWIQSNSFMFILFYSVVAKLRARNVKENSETVLCVAGDFFFFFSDV